MRRSDDALATLALVSRLSVGDVQPLKASEFWRLTAILEAGPNSLLGKSAADLAVDSGISNSLADRVAALVDRATALAFELARLEHSGVQTLTPFDEHYPSNWTQRLGSKAPPLLYAAGSVELLDTAGLGVVGSRDVSPSGAEVAVEAAKCASRHRIPLVSGGARGVDQLAMNSAFDSGGAVVGLLADSLFRKLAKSDVRAAIHNEQALMCTPYNPDAGFSAGNAMGRNKLIYAQSTLTLVVASDEGKGGTWSGATEALDHKFGRVAVWRGPGEGPGNEALERLGALPISDLDDLGRLLDAGDAETTPGTSPFVSESEQGVLFDVAAAR